MATRVTRQTIIDCVQMDKKDEFCATLKSLVENKKAEFVAGTFDQVLLPSGNVVKQSSSNSKYGFYLRCKIGKETLIIDSSVFDEMMMFSPLHLQLEISSEGKVRPDADPDVLRGTIEASRSLFTLPTLTRYATKAEIVSLLSAVYQREFPLCSQLRLSPEAFNGPVNERSRIWNKVVDRLRQLGVSMSVIRAHFLTCLTYNFGRRTMEEVMRLAGAKCFERDERAIGGHDSELVKVLRKDYLPRFWKELCDDPKAHRHEIAIFRRLCSFGMVVDSGAWAGLSVGDEMRLIERKLIDLMSHGKLGQVYELVYKLGDSGTLGIIASNSSGDPYECSVEYWMRRNAPKAFDRAMVRGDLGSAAAIVLALGAEACVPEHPQNKHEPGLEKLSKILGGRPIKTYQEAVELVGKVVEKAAEGHFNIPVDFRNYYD